MSLQQRQTEELWDNLMAIRLIDLLGRS